VVGILVGAPAFAHGEFLALPAGVAVGLVGGLIGRGRLLGESIWSITPIPPYDLYKVLRHGVVARALDPRAIILVSVLMLDMVRDFFSQLEPAWLHTLDPVHPEVQVAVWAGTLSSVGIAIKIFNSVRIESKLEDQGRLLALARYEALRSQINPHFLFNTLNSISSSIRTDSDRARAMIVKLSAILRRALEPHEDFVPLRDEIEFIDAYLDIETVRFGPRKLRVVKEIDPSLLAVPVPSMLLQPLVENAIRHGIATSLDGGTVVIRAERADGHMLLTIADDGAGMPEDQLAAALTRGIGIRNVNERLQVAYGPDHGLELKSRALGGMEVRIAIPTGERGRQAMRVMSG